jgi:CHAT domain-containing protein
MTTTVATAIKITAKVTVKVAIMMERKVAIRVIAKHRIPSVPFHFRYHEKSYAIHKFILKLTLVLHIRLLQSAETEAASAELLTLSSLWDRQ